MMPVERITGMDDLLPEQARQLRSLDSALCSAFDSFGYQPVATPVVERAELFLRKSGSDILTKLYAFDDQGGHQVTLRPEITASLIRLFVERGQAAALPVRWYYSGPVFRYERPQRGRRRQFTQVGLELIGAAGPAADAEAIAVAVAGLRAVGIGDFRVILGHVGVILQLLENLQLPDRLRGLLMANLEDLARGRREPHQIEEELRGLGLVAGADGVLTSPSVPPLRGEGGQAVGGLNPEESASLVRRMLAGIGPGTTGGRDPEEIVQRLVRKLATESEGQRLDRALRFLHEFGRVRGSLQPALAQAHEIVVRHGLNPAPLDDLREVAELLGEEGLGERELQLDFGLARGLAYYSGMVFEVMDAQPGGQQLCGGGRYDGLVRALGGRGDVPALGFAFGLERLVESVPGRDQEGLPAGPVPGMLVSWSAPGGCRRALRLAHVWRAAGRYVEVDLRGRSRRASLEYARRRGIASVALVGNQESDDLFIDTETGQERRDAFSSAE